MKDGTFSNVKVTRDGFRNLFAIIIARRIALPVSPTQSYNKTIKLSTFNNYSPKWKWLVVDESVVYSFYNFNSFILATIIYIIKNWIIG